MCKIDIQLPMDCAASHNADSMLLNNIMPLQANYKKQVIFTSFGYCNQHILTHKLSYVIPVSDFNSSSL